MRGKFAFLWVLLGASLASSHAFAELEAEDIEIQVSLSNRQDAMVETLAEWVALNTGTWNRAGLDAFAALIATPLRELDFTVEIAPGAPLDFPGRAGARTGPIVLARREADPGVKDPRRFLLVGHMDTVFESDSPFQRFERDPDSRSRASGPGTSDMKGGLVVLLETLRALRESGDLGRASWVVLLNSDEEIGSLGSRATVEAEAKRASAGFVFEPAREGGEMASARSGVGQFFLEVEGVASHVATAQRDGHSAILALAKKIVAIEALNDRDRGLIVNVGTVAGGTKRNIVPEHAEAWIDLRYETQELGEEARAKLVEIADSLDVPGTKAKLWGTLHRPPKPETPEVRRLLELHREIVRGLGQGAPEAVRSAGVTDGSLMGAVGLPTLDSMGVRGGGAHTDREFALVDSLSERATIAALVLRRLARGELELRPGLPPEPNPLESEAVQRRR